MKTLDVIINATGRLKIAICLSILVMVALAYINIQTAVLYENTHGKNRALFGWIELIRFGYKYWLLAPALLALILALIDWRKGGGKKAVLTSLLSLLTFGLVFLRLWLFLVTR
jgi:succinate dehydrogenase/fumarate reductase cytochrome b subunit